MDEPFRENTDPNFLWLGPQYRDAFATLRAAVLQNVGILILTRDVRRERPRWRAPSSTPSARRACASARLATSAPTPPSSGARWRTPWSFRAWTDPHAGGFPAHVDEFLRGAYARRERSS